MDAARTHETEGGEAHDAEAWQAIYAAPPFDFDPVPGLELDTLFRGGEPEADVCERVLASAARARGAIGVELAEGLEALG